MSVAPNLKFGATKTKPHAPAAEPNGNAPIKTPSAYNTANTPTNAEELSLHGKNSYIATSSFREPVVLISNSFFTFITHNNPTAQGVLAFT